MLNFFSKALGFPGRLVRHRTVLIVTILVVLAAGGLGWHYLETKKGESSGYTTTKAAYGSIQETVSASGEVEAVQSVTLTFESSGYVESCNVKMGDTVKDGAVLAVEQSTDLQNAVDQADASLESAQASYDKLVSTESQQLDLDQAQVDQAETAADNAKSVLDQDNQLLGIGSVSQNDANTAKSNYQSALTSYKSALYTLAQDKSQANILAAVASVKNAQANLATAQENLTNAEITAPFDGYISSITGSAGQWTGSGTAATSSSNQFEIVMTSTDLQIVADVNEADISEVSAGQAVQFTVDTYPNDTFTGKIASLSPSATAVSNVQMYEALISIDNYSLLKNGMPATIDIITASADHVLVLPQTALTYGSTYQASVAAKGGSAKQVAGASVSTGVSSTTQSVTNSSQSTGVVVVLVNGQLQIKSVKTGLSDDVNIEIISGLSEGDTVITGSKTTTTTTTSSSSSSSSSSKSSSSQGGPGGPGGIF